MQCCSVTRNALIGQVYPLVMKRVKTNDHIGRKPRFKLYFFLHLLMVVTKSVFNKDSKPVMRSGNTEMLR